MSKSLDDRRPISQDLHSCDGAAGTWGNQKCVSLSTGNSWDELRIGGWERNNFDWRDRIRHSCGHVRSAPRGDCWWSLVPAESCTPAAGGCQKQVLKAWPLPTDSGAEKSPGWLVRSCWRCERVRAHVISQVFQDALTSIWWWLSNKSESNL